jgi:hypothetical protein
VLDPGGGDHLRAHETRAETAPLAPEAWIDTPAIGASTIRVGTSTGRSPRIP